MTNQEKARAQHRLRIVEYAEVCTAHITEEDGQIISSDAHCPFRLGRDRYNAFFYIPDDTWGDIESIESTLRDRGFSETFVGIFKILREQGISYARFDGDITPIDSLPVFDW